MIKQNLKQLILIFLLATIFISSDMAYAVPNGLSVYGKPGVKSSIRMQTHGDHFKYTGKKRGKYSQVRYRRNGSRHYAWVKTKPSKQIRRRQSDLANIDFMFPKNPVLIPSYNIRSRPSTGSKKRGKAGDKKYVITNPPKFSSNGRWLKLECKNCENSWVHINALKEGRKPQIGNTEIEKPSNNFTSKHISIGSDLSIGYDDQLLPAQDFPSYDNTPEKFRKSIKGKMTVINVNKFVNMRAAPSAKTEKLDQIPLGAEVDYFDIDKSGWRRIGYNGKVGYVSPQFLKKSSAIDKNVAKNRKEAYKKVITIANKYNGCLNKTSTPNQIKRRLGFKGTRYGSKRGSLKRVIGYYHGSTLSFARSVCRSNNDPIKKAMLNGRKDKVKRQGRRMYRDALRLYSKGSGYLDHPKLNMKTYGPADGTEKNLISLYSLMLAKGMRESNGNYRATIDRNASNHSSNTTEGGIYQTSNNIHNLMTSSSRAAAKSIMAKYRNNPAACMRDIYSKKRSRHRDDNRRSTGNKNSAGRKFQDLMRTCPAASTEHGVLAIRQGMHHFGPLVRKEALPYKKCVPMFEEVFDYIKTNPSICNSLAIVPTKPQRIEDNQPKINVLTSR